MRGNEVHEKEMKESDVKYMTPSGQSLSFQGDRVESHDFETCVENIDIGGPSMLRSSAKNHASVVVVTSPDQYGSLIEERRRTRVRRHPHCNSSLLLHFVTVRSTMPRSVRTLRTMWVPT